MVRKYDKDGELNIPDTGCVRAKTINGYFGRCLDCPLPVCWEDVTEGKPKKRHQKRSELPKRNEEIRRHKKAGMTYTQIAVMFGLGEKTVEGVCRER